MNVQVVHGVRDSRLMVPFFERDKWEAEQESDRQVKEFKKAQILYHKELGKWERAHK